MQSLLNIQRIPISVEYRTQRAALQYTSPRPKLQITRERGGLEIQREPVKVKIDSYQSRASAGRKNVSDLTAENASIGRKAAQQAARTYTEEGVRLQNDRRGKGAAILDNVRARMSRTYDTTIGFIPSERPQVSTEGGTMSMQFTMDRLVFDWDISIRPQFEYIPGSFELTVTQYPDTIFEYLGDPMYVPPSADPNYEPVLDETV